MKKLQIGDKGALSKTITEEDINLFAKVSGDYNPIHMDAEAAAKSQFGERIAHGMISASLISAVLGTKFPGEGTVYLGQNLSFKLPVKIGDVITATCEVVEVKNEQKGIYRLSTIVRNQRDELVIDGEAIVKYL